MRLFYLGIRSRLAIFEQYLHRAMLGRKVDILFDSANHPAYMRGYMIPWIADRLRYSRVIVLARSLSGRATSAGPVEHFLSPHNRILPLIDLCLDRFGWPGLFARSRRLLRSCHLPSASGWVRVFPGLVKVSKWQSVSWLECIAAFVAALRVHPQYQVQEGL
jgi:hypothetical protein